MPFFLQQCNDINGFDNFFIDKVDSGSVLLTDLKGHNFMKKDSRKTFLIFFRLDRSHGGHVLGNVTSHYFFKLSFTYSNHIVSFALTVVS